MKHHKTNAEIFADARKALLGHLSIAVWSLLLFVSLSILLTEFSYTFTFSNKYLGLTLNLAVRYLTTVFISLFGIGLSSIFLRLLYDKQALVRNLLTGFFENSDTCIRVRAFITAGQFVCLLPLQLYMYILPPESISASLPVIGGLTAVCLAGFLFWDLTFAMSNYLLLDFPDLTADRILRASSAMMRGNRLRLLLLYIRLLPLHLLGVFSLGLANIWVSCCQYACITAFYKDMMTVEK
jgi:uncharacterized membrane protein